MTNVMVSDFADFSIVNVLFQATFPLIRVCFFAFFNRFFFKAIPNNTFEWVFCTYVHDQHERERVPVIKEYLQQCNFTLEA